MAVPVDYENAEIIYPAIADRLGRLRAGDRLVTFFGAVSEIERAVAAVDAQVRSDPNWIAPADVELIADRCIVSHQRDRKTDYG